MALLDVENLVSPFADGPRSGTDLRDSESDGRFTEILSAVRSARSKDDSADREVGSEAEESRRLAKSAWQVVWEKGQTYIQKVGKDLEVAAWMVEASIPLFGFVGLKNSLDLASRLVSDYWTELYPGSGEEEGFRATILPIARLNAERVALQIRRISLTDDVPGSGLSTVDYEEAKRLQAVSENERAIQIERGAISMDEFNREIAQCSISFLQEKLADIRAVRDLVQGLCDLLGEKAGQDNAPNLNKFQESLAKAEASVVSAAGARLSSSDVAMAQAPEVLTQDVPSSAGVSVAGGIRNRQDALNLLEKVAIWFENHEPQSILPAEVRKSIRRARMTPLQLYADLIGNEQVRNEVYKDVGILPPVNNS